MADGDFLAEKEHREENSVRDGKQSFTMSKALELLHSEISAEVLHYEQMKREQQWRQCFSTFHHQHVKSQYHWTTCVLTFLMAILLLVGYGFSTNREAQDNTWLIIEAVILIVSLVANVCLNLVVWQQERSETERLVRLVLEELAKCINYNTWSSSCFTPLDSPQSPSMSLQWTLRDKQIVNLPNVLLVKGDIIYLRPGQTVPARCQEIVDSSSIDGPAALVLNEGDIYNPEPDKETVTTPRARQPMRPKQFILLDTPYVSCLRNLLQDVTRPASIIEHETYTISHNWVERRLIPILLVVSVATNALRYMYLQSYVGDWTEMFITLQIQTILPLISVVLPVMWLILNSYGQARVFAAFEAAKGSMSLCENSFDTDSSISADEARINLQWTNVQDWFKIILLGKAPAVTKKINIVHILGSVTSLCCVDKKGILSYPNPSPEKVFFLQNPPEESQTELNDSDSLTENKDYHHHREKYEKKHKKTDPGSRHHSLVEVLDLTHDPKKEFGLDFDDPGWQERLSSLKPLGLTILANTCNPRTVEWYSQFTDHVACAALENEETVAVVNKRCLCSLARQIGFSEKAVEIFKLEKILGMYRQVSQETTTKERLQRAKSFVQNKIPMPNMVSVIVRETISGSCQLLSQGTAEILLSCCSDYWNGEDLTELTENDRKRITDFYHRTSIGSYCSAFSYRPITRCVAQSVSDMYLELPGDNQLFSAQQECSDNNLLDEGVDIGSDSSFKGQQRSFSVDSLFDTSSIMSTEDAAGCFQSQCNQIFIGMVTMQYQARQDFIQLIDKLEGACIRFVQFSQENEVRSRVFSEKMGLEAGWNCHISLRSEKQYLSSINQSDRGNEGFSSADVSGATSSCSSRHPSDSKQKGNDHMFENRSSAAVDISRSAPSIVNLGSSQVKFEKKVKATLVSPRKVRRQDSNEYSVTCLEEVTLLNHDSKVDGHADPHSECVIEFEEDLNVDSDDGESRIASSYVTENTEDSLTGALDNRAKLPRGIENIRPHLRSVDNVPLLVNLFTDCTVETTCEMIAIMQEYGEVVLCVGSSLNIQNMPIFLLADCSLALEPWYPQVCLHAPYVPPNNHIHQSPSELAGSLLSVICPLMIGRKENISLIHLIAEARSHLMSMRTCFYFMLCCSLSVSLTQLLASTLLFPPVLAPQHVLWLILFIIPLLSLTMMGNPVDARVMTLATRKNMDHITAEMLFRFITYNLIRFVPPVLTALFCYCRTLLSFCYSHPASHNGTSCAVYDFVISTSADDGDWYARFSGGLVVAQNILLFLLVLYFEIISVSFVHWTDHIWQQCPSTNKLWLCVIPIVLLCQILFFVCDIFIRNGAVSSTLSLSDITPDVWAVGLAAPVLFVIVNELVKHREIKIAVRYQKRARLDFGTKLGMNSPF